MAGFDSTGKSPAFQFYPKDFLTDEHVRLMSLQERGAYITLLCQCWTEGSLPADVGALARLCGTPAAAFKRLWPALAACFRAVNGRTDRLTHPRLDLERRKQREYRRRQADAGKQGAESRWRKDGGAIQSPSSKNGSATVSPMAKNGSSSSSSVSDLRSSDSSHKDTRVRSLAEEPTELTERAGLFVRETYPALYAKYRKGARYLSKPALDFQEALELCRVWDDDRLVKIASVFLKTNHDFAEQGSRTMAQFRALASWCDSRLAEEEAKAGIA